MTADTDNANRLKEWLTFQEGDITYPFVEDENCNITGYGHQSKFNFATWVNRYDVEVGGIPKEDTAWTYLDVAHRWAVMDPDGERFWARLDYADHVEGTGIVGPDTPGAFPITTIWGAR